MKNSKGKELFIFKAKKILMDPPDIKTRTCTAASVEYRYAISFCTIPWVASKVCVQTFNTVKPCKVVFYSLQTQSFADFIHKY